MRRIAMSFVPLLVVLGSQVSCCGAKNPSCDPAYRLVSSGTGAEVVVRVGNDRTCGVRIALIGCRQALEDIQENEYSAILSYLESFVAEKQTALYEDQDDPETGEMVHVAVNSILGREAVSDVLVFGFWFSEKHLGCFDSARARGRAASTDTAARSDDPDND